MRTTENLDPFWAKVDKTAKCWNWMGAVSPTGYGYYWANGRNNKAHRISFEEANGPIPSGRYIDHICHNTSCVRPSHLRLATQKQNMENLLGANANSKSGIRGVFWSSKRRKWTAAVVHNGKRIHIGHFQDVEEAHAAAVAKRLELFTHNDADRLADAS